MTNTYIYSLSLKAPETWILCWPLSFSLHLCCVCLTLSLSVRLSPSVSPLLSLTFPSALSLLSSLIGLSHLTLVFMFFNQDDRSCSFKISAADLQCPQTKDWVPQ